jgi:hypothetical protein
MRKVDAGESTEVSHQTSVVAKAPDFWNRVMTYGTKGTYGAKPPQGEGGSSFKRGASPPSFLIPLSKNGEGD